MRLKCEDRRKAIVRAATALFRELGFERCSMAQISARVGGSKATLYSYFKSKDELFAAAMVDAMQDQGAAMIALLDPVDPDVAGMLARFGAAYLDFVTSSQCLDNVRTAIAGSGKNELGAALWRLGPKKGWNDVAQYFEAVIARGGLRAVDPNIAAMHFKGLLEIGYVIPMLFGAEPEYDAATVVREGVAVFMRAYGVD